MREQVIQRVKRNEHAEETLQALSLNGITSSQMPAPNEMTKPMMAGTSMAKGRNMPTTVKTAMIPTMASSRAV